MQPKTFEQANCNLIGDGDSIGDLQAYRYAVRHDDRTVAIFFETRWKLSDAERKAIADGGDVVLTVMGQVFQPVILQVTHGGNIVPDDA